jgi:hypothetical protein
MQTNLGTRKNTSAAVLSRAIELKNGAIPPAGARYILNVGIREKDKKRALVLFTKQQEGTITPKEKDTLNSYVQADNMLSILKAKALLALKRAGQKP